MSANLIPANVLRALLLDSQLEKRLQREAMASKRGHAERRRDATRKVVRDMADAATPEARIAAAKARAHSVHAKIEEIAAAADFNLAKLPLPPLPPAQVRIDDLAHLFAVRHQLDPLLRQSLEIIFAKINWSNRDGQPAYFNKAVHKNSIPLDQRLAILAHMCQPVDDGDLHLAGHVKAVLECGLFSHVKRGKFHYGHRCQDAEHCDLCNYLNINCGLKIMQSAYSSRAFARGVNFYAITIAPRWNPEAARALGGDLQPDDWNFENSGSLIYGESRVAHVFKYPPVEAESADWEIQSVIRQFLGAGQYALGKLYRNHWVTGLRARVENSIHFLPYAEHWHTHAVASSPVFHDPQCMADFLKEQVESALGRLDVPLFGNVKVAVISSAEDLRKWIEYLYKTIDLIQPVHSVYNRHPNLVRGDANWKTFIPELRAYLNRNRMLFKGARLFAEDEKGRHTYTLRRNYVLGNHGFGMHSILSEPQRHKEWRLKHCADTRKARAHKRLQAAADL